MTAAAQFSQVTVTRYGRTETVAAAVVTCLWYSVSGSQPVTVVIVRDKPDSDFGIALVTTDRDATADRVIERYASRWSIEIAIEDSKQLFGTGHARNRTAAAVKRTVPFQIACQAVAVTWYTTADHDPADLHERRASAPWYASKAEPATADIAAKLRRVIIAARFRHLALTSQHRRNSPSSGWPGKMQRPSPLNSRKSRYPRDVLNRSDSWNSTGTWAIPVSCLRPAKIGLPPGCFPSISSD